MNNVPVDNDATANDNRERQSFAPKSRLKKKKRRKDLEHLRRNVLAAKRNLKRQSLPTRRNISNKLSKNSLKTTLNMFAEVRRDNENKTQGLVDRKNGRKPRGKTICARLLPEPVIGIFKNGVKSKDVRRKVVKNFPSYGMNKERLHADVFGLPNDEKHYSSCDETTLNNGNIPDNLDRNKRNENEYNFHSISHHNVQPFDMIKDNSTFNNVNSPKWISNPIGMKSSGEMRQIMSQNVSGNVKKGDIYKRRVLKSSYDDDDHDTGILTEIETQYFSQNPLKVGGNLIQKELPTNRICDKVRSIKRWGISPAFCYDEFSKMIEEKFVFCSSQADVSDPLMSIRATLVARYAEAREYRTNINNDSEDSCTSCALTDDKISNSKQSETVHKSQIDSWTITRISPQNNRERMNFLQDHSSLNTNYENKFISMNEEKTHDNTHEFRRKFGEQNTRPREYIRSQGEKSLNCDWIIEPFLSSEQAFMKEQEKYFRRDTHNIPIPRRSDSGTGISFDIDIDEFCGMDSVTSFQQTQKKLMNNKKFRDCLTHGSPNFGLSPEIVVDQKKHEKSSGIETTNEMMRNYEFSMLKNGAVKAHKSSRNNYFRRVDSSKYEVNKIATPSQIDFDDIRAPNYHHNNHPIYTEEHGYFSNCDGPRMPRSKSMHCNKFLPTMNNSTDPLDNHHYIEHNDRGIVPIPDMDAFQNSDVPFWCTSDFNLDTESNFIPINAKSTLRRHARHYSDPNVQLNNNVLHEFKDLSFEESDPDQASSLNDKSRYNIGNKQRNPRSCSNLYQPSKYYAVSNENVNDRVPRRVPVFINAKNPQSMSEMIDDEVLCRVDVLKKSRKSAAASHALNLESKSRIVSDRHGKYEKKLREFPITFNRNFPINSCDGTDAENANSTTIANSNVRFEQSFNPNSVSHACEVVLNDGRIGLFVPRNYL